MALTIATNNAALNAAAAASSVNRDMETSMARLSSGKRINSASDDAAGVAISSRLSAEIRGTDQAIRNALDGQALIDTAEGAHKEIENILQRMREIAVQSANDTNSFVDRSNLSQELIALQIEMNRISKSTAWAGQSLFTGGTANDGVGSSHMIANAGSTQEFTFHVDAGVSSLSQVTVKIEAIDSVALGVAGVNEAMLLYPPHISTTLTAFADSKESHDWVIGTLDNALAHLNTYRASLGAISNRLNYTVNNLTNISTNLSAAKGSIEDTDFAKETTDLAKNQILQQASTAMLAQANASKQNVLSLLQG